MGLESDGAPARVWRSQPTSDAIEDAARRLCEVVQHDFRRRRCARFRGADPRVELRGRARGALLDAGFLEDHVGRLGGGIGHAVRHQAAHRADALQRRGEPAIVAGIGVGPRQCGDVANHREHEAVAQPRRALRGEQPQHRAFERVAGVEAGDAIMGHRRAHELQKLRCDPRAAGAQAAHEHAQAGAVRRTELTRHGRAGRGDEELLDVCERAQLGADLGELAAQLR